MFLQVLSIYGAFGLILGLILGYYILMRAIATRRRRELSPSLIYNKVAPLTKRLF